MTDLPKFISGARLGQQIGISPELLYRASDQKQFARYYLFGKRKFYDVAEVAAAIKNVVPGDPDRWRRVVESIDAACPARASRLRRATPNRRGSSAPTS